MTDYTNKEIDRLLKGKRHPGEEDLQMLQPDGSRACVGWELNKGFHLYKPKKEKELSNDELLKSAYKKFEKKKKKD
jgi:hypothetical protein